MPIAGPKTALIKGMFKEVLRTLKDDSAYLAQADQLHTSTSGAAVAVLGAQPDAYRALARVQQALIASGGDARAAWAAGKLRAKARLRQAYAAAERRYDEAVGRADTSEAEGGGAAAPPPPPEEASTSGASGSTGWVVEGSVSEAQLQELYGSDGAARAAVMYTLAHLGRAWMTQLNTTDVEVGASGQADCLLFRIHACVRLDACSGF